MTLSDAGLARLRALSPELPATDRYEPIDELGRGGMGVVYRVRDRQLGREVALKVPYDDASPTAVARLEQEIGALAALEHPGVVPIHDSGVLPDGRPFHVMKLVRGDTLSQRLHAGMSRGDALRVFLRVCETVSFAHAHGILHRDLTPRNVMLGPFGDVLVVDWGIARRSATTESMPTSGGASANTSSTGSGTGLGTPGYMAPEQEREAASVDERADVFALGCMLRDILQRARDDAPVPAPLLSVVRRAAATAIVDRYQTVEALSRDVSDWLDGRPVSAHRESVVERLERLVRRHRVAITLVLVYLIVRLIILVVFRR